MRSRPTSAGATGLLGVRSLEVRRNRSGFHIMAQPGGNCCGLRDRASVYRHAFGPFAKRQRNVPGARGAAAPAVRAQASLERGIRRASILGTCYLFRVSFGTPVFTRSKANNPLESLAEGSVGLIADSLGYVDQLLVSLG